MRRAATRRAATSNWQRLRSELTAAADAVRYNPDPAAAPPPRAERLAAGGVAVLVLIGAVGTYLTVVGGVTPASGTPPTRPARAPVPTVTTTAPTTSAPVTTSLSRSSTHSPTRATTSTGTRAAGVSEHATDRNRQ
jgi:hypothetical protein